MYVKFNSFKNHINAHTQLFTINKSSSPHFTSTHFCAVHFCPFSAFLISHNPYNFSHTIPPLDLTTMNVIQLALIFQFNVQKGK
jgi:hypothetical protein